LHLTLTSRHLPPLRERKADIPDLVEHFVQQFAASMDKSIESIPQETMRSLVRHQWPGNIRELQNYIARGVILSNDGVFEPAPLERHWSPRFQIPPSKTRYVEKFSLLASALIGRSEVREEQLPDLA
jgi:DNA-binding NtrC family response regulator